jgi:hypothetical protein
MTHLNAIPGVVQVVKIMGGTCQRPLPMAMVGYWTRFTYSALQAGCPRAKLKLNNIAIMPISAISTLHIDNQLAKPRAYMEPLAKPCTSWLSVCEVEMSHTDQ